MIIDALVTIFLIMIFVLIQIVYECTQEGEPCPYCKCKRVYKGICPNCGIVGKP